MLLRRILNKLIARVGVNQVMAVTCQKSQKLIKYVERARKKVVNARHRLKLLALIGEEEKSKDLKLNDSDSDIEDMSDGSGSDKVSDQEMKNDSADESELESSDEEIDGTDALQSSAQFDIPYVVGIPVFSQLAKEQKQQNAEQQA